MNSSSNTYNCVCFVFFFIGLSLYNFNQHLVPQVSFINLHFSLDDNSALKRVSMVPIILQKRFPYFNSRRSCNHIAAMVDIICVWLFICLCIRRERKIAQMKLVRLYSLLFFYVGSPKITTLGLIKLYAEIGMEKKCIDFFIVVWFVWLMIQPNYIFFCFKLCAIRDWSDWSVIQFSILTFPSMFHFNCISSLNDNVKRIDQMTCSMVLLAMVMHYLLSTIDDSFFEYGSILLKKGQMNTCH